MSDMRNDLKAIYSEAISAVNPENAVRDHVKCEDNKLVLLQDKKKIKEFDLARFDKIFVVGSGKATSSMAKAIEGMIKGKIDKGLITVKYGYTEDLDDIEIIEASHPIPDANGVEGSKKIVEILKFNATCMF